MMTTVISRPLLPWLDWRAGNAINRTHRRVLRRYPRLRELGAERSRPRYRRRPVREIDADLRNTMTELLKGSR